MNSFYVELSTATGELLWVYHYKITPPRNLVGKPDVAVDLGKVQAGAIRIPDHEVGDVVGHLMERYHVGQIRIF